MDERPDIWLGMGRVGWLRVQFFVGVTNAISAVYAIEAGRWISAALSALCVLICACWHLPKAPRKPLSKTEKDQHK